MIFQANVDLCKKIAEKSTFHRVRVGAVIAKRKRVLSVGWNRAKTHPLTVKYGYERPCGIHAELDACLGLDLKQMEGAVIYTARLKVDGSEGLARPCKGCLNLLSYCNIRGMCYTTGDKAGSKYEEI